MYDDQHDRTILSPMNAFSPNQELVVLQVCADRLAAEVVANLLRAESVPAVVRNFAAIPGLDQGAEVLVPAPMLQRARGVIAYPGPSDAELTFLATGNQESKR